MKNKGHVKLLLLIAFFISSINEIDAQVSSNQYTKKNGEYYVVTVYDTSNNSFFNHHPTVEKISVSYHKGSPDELFLYFKNDQLNANKEYYDLNYVVDSFVWKSLYPAFHYSTKCWEKHHTILFESSCHKCEIATATIFVDSIIFSLTQQLVITKDKEEREKRILTTIPKYRGNINLIATNNIKRYDKRVLKYADSIVVFRGIINKKGNLGDLKLLVGKESAYTDQVKKELLLSNGQWEPAKFVETNQLYDSYIRIYIRMNKNRTITVLTSPRKMRNLTGK